MIKRKGFTMQTLKELFFHICEDEGYKLVDILNAYNQKYNDNMQATNFYKSINNNVMKYKILVKVLDSINYNLNATKRK